MIDAHIEEGDVVIAERTMSARDGDIVVAEVDGEWTLKYYRKLENKVFLMPGNKKYKPIYLRRMVRMVEFVRGVVTKF